MRRLAALTVLLTILSSPEFSIEPAPQPERIIYPTPIRDFLFGRWRVRPPAPPMIVYPRLVWPQIVQPQQEPQR